MAQPIYIVGHKNPDNDSIAAAVGLAYLKTKIAERQHENDEQAEIPEYIPCRLGPLPPESKWVLDTYGVEEPRLISDAHPHVADVMNTNAPQIYDEVTLLDAMAALKRSGSSAAVVLDEMGSFESLVTSSTVGRCLVTAASGQGDQVMGSVTSGLVQNVSHAFVKNIAKVSPDMGLDEAKQALDDAHTCWAVVLDKGGAVMGTLHRHDIHHAQPLDFILVDHNESTQAADGMKDANVIEVIDHHRIGDFTTAAPIEYLAMPWGSTATIITTRFRSHGIEIPKSTAAVLLSAILTDTVILKSPTATAIDEEQVAYLSDIVDVDPTEFGMTVFKTRGGDADMPIDSFVTADAKEFKIGDGTVLISQHETVDSKTSMEREDEARAYMKQLQVDKGYKFVLLLVTDILKEGSYFLVEGDHAMVDKVFGIDSAKAVWMPGVMSRKKQVAAPILSA